MLHFYFTEMAMKERDLLKEIGRIAGEAESLTAALGNVQTLLADQCGGALLIIRPEGPSAAISAAPAVCAFLESRQFPVRGFYSTPLHCGAVVGTFVACIGTWGVPCELLRRVTNFAGQQFAELARRLAMPILEYVEAA
jgi:hypothetical protein